MAAPVSGNLLKATQAIIWLILILLGVVAFAVIVAAIALPIKWDDVAAYIARERLDVNFSAIAGPLYAIFGIGLFIIGLAAAIMRKLLAIIGTVSEGDPFVRANAVRLKAIGWMMVVAQILGFPLYTAASQVAAEFGKHDLDGDMPIMGLLGILLTFVLAGVFEQGAAMREEMEGTV